MDDPLGRLSCFERVSNPPTSTMNMIHGNNRNPNGYSHRYPHDIDSIRQVEYPMLKDAVYLDHAGKPPAPSSLIQRFSQDMLLNLQGNPHAMSLSSQRASHNIDRSRLSALNLFNADPAHFALIFVANATAGIKLITDCLRKHPRGFQYFYHKDSHTSLVGAREQATAGAMCLESDADVEAWFEQGSGYRNSVGNAPMKQQSLASSDVQSCSASSSDYSHSTSPSTAPTSECEHDEAASGAHWICDPLQLFAWPAQSNMDGRRLPLHWAQRTRASFPKCRYTLLDVAALVATAPLDLSDADDAPDFTILSFYKMFGFPEIGAVIVRKAAAHLLQYRGFFGGGTVDMVTCLQEQWHVTKASSISAALEDGTLPVHSIRALEIAIQVHKQIYGSFDAIARHTHDLTRLLYSELGALRHENSQPVCKIYSPQVDAHKQGPTVAFNIMDAHGRFVSCTEVERLAGLHDIHVRTGGLCNPGGVAHTLCLSPQDLNRSRSAGFKCGSERDIIDGRPMGMIRASLGPMSSKRDIERFVGFVQDLFVESNVFQPPSQPNQASSEPIHHGTAVIDELIVYPIKSCSGLSVPPKTPWSVSAEGLAWDREWCIVHEATGEILTQKRYPRMALVQPHLDFANNKLSIELSEPYDSEMNAPVRNNIKLSVPLGCDLSMFDSNPSIYGSQHYFQLYANPAFQKHLSIFLNVPCRLARFIPALTPTSLRHANAQSKVLQSLNKVTLAGDSEHHKLSNESPILAVTRESIARLNEQIMARHYEQVSPDQHFEPICASVFRPNIVFTASAGPYDEDHWVNLRSTCGFELRTLGSCRRCQMVCTVSSTGERRKDAEPLATLTRTRRRQGGGAWFGVHMRFHASNNNDLLQIGDSLTITRPSR